MRTFLIGGGRGGNTAAAHEPFVRAVADRGPGPVVVYLLDDPDADPARWSATLADAGATGSTVITVSRDRPPRRADLDGAAGVYVAGGLTPAYRDVLVDHGGGWLAAVRAARPASLPVRRWPPPRRWSAAGGPRTTTARSRSATPTSRRTSTR